jgi:CBS domain-containing protein
MKVKDVMTETPAFCDGDTNLGAAVEILWNRNCGILPIVDTDEKVVGVVTDRDICIALGTRNRLPWEITVGEVTTGKVFSCIPNDDVRTALATMAQAKVRRLPVVNAEGKLEGILSMDDVVLHSGIRAELSYDQVMDTLKELYRRTIPERPRKKTATA